MATLKLSYCQLIRIILAQIGGSPLQQLYTQLTQGLPNIIRGGPLPNGLAQLKELVDTITNELNNATEVLNDFNNLTNELAKKFFQNPASTAITAAIAAIDARLATLDCGGADADECAELNSTRASLVSFKDNTDILAGVKSPADNQGSCSLQDLLGSGCARNTDVPDVDLQTILDSFSKKTDIQALATAIERAVANGLGFAEFSTQLSNLKNTISSINNSFRLTVNKAAIKNAVLASVNQIVFNLLSGCGNNVLAETLKTDVKSKLQPFVEIMAKQQEGTVYISSTGQVVSGDGKPLTLSDGSVIATVTADSGSTKFDSNLYIN